MKRSIVRITLSAIFLLSITFASKAQQVININSSNDNQAQTSSLLDQPAPDITFKNLMNSNVSELSLAGLKGKVVILEFWATWCGPCIPAMDHLSDLKKAFPEKLEVIAISDEKPERIQKFIHNKPSSIIFYSDPAHSLQSVFQFTSIPHSVVINKDGVVAAVTSPDEIREESIAQLLKGNKISLRQKIESTERFDLRKEYFPKPAGFDAYSFDLQPPIPGAFPMTRKNAAGEWAGRRITMLNSPVNLVFRTAFQKASVRVVYENVTAEEFDHRTAKDLYCVDVIVPRGKENDLFPYLQRQLEQVNFEYKCKLEKRMMDVAVFSCADPAKWESFKSKSSAPSQAGQSFVRATSFEKNNVPVSELMNHFESFGILKVPVEDQTNLKDVYDISFNFEAEDPYSFKRELEKIGLRVERQKKEIEVLVIYKTE